MASGHGFSISRHSPPIMLASCEEEMEHPDVTAVSYAFSLASMYCSTSCEAGVQQCGASSDSCAPHPGTLMRRKALAPVLAGRMNLGSRVQVTTRWRLLKCASKSIITVTVMRLLAGGSSWFCTSHRHDERAPRSGPIASAKGGDLIPGEVDRRILTERAAAS
jgi:hypothetical protein